MPRQVPSCNCPRIPPSRNSGEVQRRGILPSTSGAALTVATMLELAQRRHTVVQKMGFEPCVKMLKALADDTRWRIVRALLVKPMTVNEVTRHVEATQYNVSKHLRILREAGIVETTKSGTHVECRVAEAFREQLTEDQTKLDLGCCSFNFDCPPKSSAGLAAPISFKKR